MKIPSTLPKTAYKEALLEPVNPRFILLTIVLALLFNLFPWGDWHGIPDLLALTLFFWSLREPYYFGMTAAFSLGLIMDVQQASLLGQHALLYTLLSFAAISLQKRILWFPPRIQVLYVFPIFCSAQALVWLITSVLTQNWGSWLWILDNVIASMLWPLLSWLLLAPQRHAPDRDDNRPI